MNVVQKMSDEEKGIVLIASSNYKGGKKNSGIVELSFKEGDIFVNCEVFDKDFFKGKLKSTGELGRIPKTYVISLSDDELTDNGDDSNSLNITPNPLCDEASTQNNGTFSPMCNYVDMSSDESIHNIKETSSMLTKEIQSESNKNQEKPKPPDEGYNSSSHYSSETQDSEKPSRYVPVPLRSQQDEAGYEVPNICIQEMSSKKIQRKDKRRKSLKSLLKLKSTANASGIESDIDEARQQFYDPPVDHSDINFPHHKTFLRLRMLLSTLAAILIFLLIFLTLLLLVKLHALLSFSLAAIVFITILVVPATFKKTHILCLTALLFPSLASSKSKSAILIMIGLFILIGPIFGTVIKLDTAWVCSTGSKNFTGTTNFKSNTGSLYKNSKRNMLVEDAKEQPVVIDCQKSFGLVQEYCLTNYDRFKRVCERRNLELSRVETQICQKNDTMFCFTKESIIKDLCNANIESEKQVAESNEATLVLVELSKHLNSKRNNNIASVRNYLLYLAPLLILLLFWDTYDYNVSYLTTKAEDNVYITRRIKEIDVERQNRGLTDVIIPLTRIEFQYYILRSGLTLSKAERLNLIKWILIWTFCLIVSQLLILLEDSVHDALVSIQSDSCVWYYKTVTENSYRLVLHLTIGVFILIILLQSYVLRLRSLICDYFYPESIDTRSKYLYYKILHDRNTFSKQLKRKVQLLSERKRLLRRISYLSVLNKILPPAVQAMISRFRWATCMICDSLTQRIIECDNSSCQADFCYACYVDCGQSCLICRSGCKDV